MTTLKAQIAADVSTVFINTDEFADALTLYVDSTTGVGNVTFNGVVEPYDLEGTREAHGDGVVLERDAGRALRQSIRITCAASVALSDKQRRQQVLKWGSDYYAVQRIIAKDDYFQIVICVRTDKVTTKHLVKSG
jgi:hypothetical protein